MTGLWIALAGLAIAVAVLALFLLRRAKPREELAAIREATRALSEEVGRLSQLLSGQLSGLSEQVGKQLAATAQLLQRQEGTLGQRLAGVQGLVADVKEKLGALEEASRRIAELAQDIASLQDILRAPKARGGLGEWLLSELLAQVLPKERYALQYAFKGGERVDAAIFLSGMVVPVDAKFPLEAFQKLLAAAGPDERRKYKRELLRAAKKHVDAVADKYIRPAEGTGDFALMYVPAEGVFLELITPDEGIEAGFVDYAWSRRVVPCSPNTFYAYLQSVALGLRGLSLAENVERVLGELRELTGQLSGVEREFRVLGNHLRNAQGKYDQVERALQVVSARLERLVKEEPE
ncbi:TPA: DNA recombination protein RmuC [Candidatus Bipolaricaulota bacterium]|nr:DNA recombination protein RmuC [Candidatus Bipolaricaulota bacterium]HIP99021.1 DNA recombination protein RmuC [Candidatus Bipolaricaulota bacterium]